MTEKVKFLRKFNEAFANSDTDFIIANVSDNIQWVIYGDKEIIGIEAFKESVLQMKSSAPIALELDQIIIQGNAAAVNGTITMEEDGKSTTYAFSDIYKLSGSKNLKVSEMKSYILNIKQA